MAMLMSNLHERPTLLNGQLSTTATLFSPGGQSMHWILSKPLYNWQFFSADFWKRREWS